MKSALLLAEKHLLKYEKSRKKRKSEA